MSKFFSIFLVLVLFVSTRSFAIAQTKPEVTDLSITKNDNFNHNLWDDTKETMDLMVKGSYMQFTEPSSLILLGASIAFFIPFWNSDKKLSGNLAKKKDYDYEGIASELGVAANFPFLSLATYAIGRSKQDEKLIKYSQEVTAATTLALVEASVISIVPLHPRPSPDNLSVWETAFRYESSFPSGHTVGWNVITFKTFQFYGVWPALVPAGFTYLASVERVKTDKHYLSDVIGSSVIALMASEGVRAAAEHKNNHPVYKWIFEHDFKVGFSQLDNKSIGTMSFTF